MRKFLCFLTAATLMFGFTACTEHDDEQGSTSPKFPAAEEHYVTAVGVSNGYTYQATLNVDWQLTLTDNEEGHFSMQEDGTTVDTVSGKADQTKKVVVYANTAANQGETHSATLTMTAVNKGTSRVVLTVKHSADNESDNYVVLYTGKLDNLGGWAYGDTGGYAYSETPVAADGTIELYRPAGSMWYMQPIAVNAPEGYKLELPEWLDVTDPKKEENGLETMQLRAVNTYIEEPEGEIVFSYDDGYTATYKVTIPAYGKFFEMTPAGQMNFNANGVLTSSEGRRLSFSAVEGFKVFTYTKHTEMGGGSTYYEADADWFTVETAADEYGEEDAYIADWKASVTVTENTSEAAREGLVMIIPAYVVDELLESGVSEDELAYRFVANTVVPEYESYVFATLLQEGVEVTVNTDALSPADPSLVNHAGAMVFFEKAQSEQWWPGTSDLAYYKLIYNNKFSYDEGWLALGTEYQGGGITFKYYDCDGMPFDEDDELNGLNAFANASQLRVDMDYDNAKWRGVDYDKEGFVIVFKDGKAFACIYCIYHESYTYEGGDDGGNTPGTGGSDIEVTFASDDYWGADIIQVTETSAEVLGLDWEEVKIELNEGAAVWALKYWTDDYSDVAINTPWNCMVTYTPRDLSWFSSDVEEYEYCNATMTIDVTVPQSGEETVCKVQFIDNSTWSTKVYLYVVNALE